MARKSEPGLRDIVAALEAHFGERVRRITAPGGKRRDSFRAYFADRSVIVTYRRNQARARLEAFLLEALAPHCDAIPQFLGQREGLLFQSDVGETRLSQAAVDGDDARREALAADAVAAIFRIHAAARKADVLAKMPHLGATAAWVEAVVDGADDLASYARRGAPRIDRPALCAALAQPAAQAMKWDCRSGNAALDREGALRWFDFEYAGARHGAEDFAWLLGDEVWPVPADRMLEIVGDAFDPGSGHDRAAYLDYLALYTTFHAIQRIKLIVGEVKRRGWTSQGRAVRYDKVGTHPLLGVQVSLCGAATADRSPLTRSLVPLFEATAQVFRDTIQDDSRQPAA